MYLDKHSRMAGKKQLHPGTRKRVRADRANGYTRAEITELALSGCAEDGLYDSDLNCTACPLAIIDLVSASTSRMGKGYDLGALSSFLMSSRIAFPRESNFRFCWIRFCTSRLDVVGASCN